MRSNDLPRSHKREGRYRLDRRYKVKCVMVVEDDVLMCDELLDMLTKAGYRAVKPDGFDRYWT